MTNKDKSVIPSGIMCVGQNGYLCPYYKKAGKLKLNKDNCEFSKHCKKDCKKEGCENEFFICRYKGKVENYSNKQFLLASRYKICGVNVKKES